MVTIFLYMRFEASILNLKTVNISKSQTGLKLIHMSDIHIGKLKVSRKKIFNKVRLLNPDAVVITGDLLDTEKQTCLSVDFLSNLTKYCRVIMCPGNHDYEAFNSDKNKVYDYFQMIRSTGTELLINESVIIEKNKKQYCITGIDDIRRGKPDILKAYSSGSDSYMNITLAHNPDTVFILAEDKVDYMLCGHFHGGQIWTPFGLEFKILRGDRLCKEGKTRGFHRINGITVYINRGLGNVVVPLRFLSRPEMTLFNFP